MEVTGIPTVQLMMSFPRSREGFADAEADGDVFVSLQCVQEDGVAAYVTEGCLRLKHRKYIRFGDLMAGKDVSEALSNGRAEIVGGEDGRRGPVLENISHLLPVPYVPVRSFEKRDVIMPGTKIVLYSSNRIARSSCGHHV